MSLFENKNPESSVSKIEFASEGDKHFIFLHTKPRTEEQKINDWIKNCGLELQEIARTHYDGHEVIVVQSDKSQQEVLQALHAKGEQLEEHKEKSGLNLWKLRGWASIIGQPLQLASGLFQKGNIDAATVGFASANMIANITNIVFGAEKKEDVNRLHFLKTDINRDLDEHLPKTDKPFDPDSSRMSERGGEKKGSATAGAYDFMKQNSVKIGEIGLRYFGAAVLAFPTTNWKAGGALLAKGKFGEAFHALKNKDAATFAAGATYLIDKSIAFGSKIPDPYDTKPHTALDTVREEVLFPASSVIETIAAGFIAKDRLLNPKRRITWPKWTGAPKEWQTKGTQDYLGGIGGLLFMSGLIIRIFAPFGKKEMDMDEMTAHITDTLIKTPPQEMPRLLADSAATVAEHMKDKDVAFGDVFTIMASDLEKYHHVALLPKAPNDTQIAASTPEPQTPTHHADKVERKNEADGYGGKLAKTGATHADRALQTTPLQLSV